MDVYLKDEDKVINVEMQTANHGDLAKRARYYQAAADIDTTPKGSRYRDLRQNYVIFICKFDPFGRGKPLYHFQNYCLEHGEPIPLEDGTTKIFLNTACKVLDSLDGKLRLFYDYMSKKPAQTDFTRELDNSISKLKEEKEERSMYLTYGSRMMEYRREGFEEGREDGISIGLKRGAYQKALETAKSMLHNGISISLVVDCTKLPLETVKQLAKSL